MPPKGGGRTAIQESDLEVTRIDTTFGEFRRILQLQFNGRC
jgi:hypothetical protein